jgi:Kef-type K+ transport system membrane component KefB
MSHHDLILFFLQVCTMLGVALVCGQAMRKLHQPAVLGELIGGVLLGPTIFGAFAPKTYSGLFHASDVASTGREAVIRLGLLFFMFVAGLEVDMAHVRQRGLSVVLTSALGIVLPFGLGFGLVLTVPALFGSQAQGRTMLFALFMGMAMSISAIPVIARILMDLDLLKRELGTVVMAAATIDDLVGWSLFAVILSRFAPGGLHTGGPIVTLAVVVGLFAAILTVGRWAGPRALHWLQSHLAWPSGFIGVTTMLVLVAASLTEALGIHAVFGAFLVGVALAETSEAWTQAHDVVYQFAISLFAPLYFVSVGLKADFVANFDLPLVLTVLLIACLGKVVGAGLGARLGGLPTRHALAVGFGMNARGAMEMILASVALEYGLIDQRVFVALVVMALVTSMLSGPVMQRLLGARPSPVLAPA